MFNLFHSKALYKILATLEGPQDAVTSLAFSVDGKFLAATGTGGVNVWNLETLVAVPLMSRQAGPQPPEKVGCPAVIWTYFADRSRHVLLLGTWDGRLQLWDYREELLALESTRKSLTHAGKPPNSSPCQVLSIDVHPKEVALGGQIHVVASFFDRTIWMGSLRGEGELKRTFSITLEEGFIPKTVRFDSDTGNILVFAWHSGAVAFLDSHTGAILWRKTDAPKLMGSVSLDTQCKNFIACTPHGFEIWNLERIALVKKLEQHPIVLLLPKHACFVEGNTRVVGGTDRGCAEVFDIETGKVAQRLKYNQSGLVQSVATSLTKDRYLVATGGSNGNQPCDVILWYRDRPVIASGSCSDDYMLHWTIRIPLKKKHLRFLRASTYAFLIMILIIGQFFVALIFADVSIDKFFAGRFLINRTDYLVLHLSRKPRAMRDCDSVAKPELFIILIIVP
ncbi:quinon protein alcohol dehydrogenase-like superfamily [Lentinula raphanica]|nr:quinon protein alcohol dehydrogenase-like superfamily [Lentinula raphanica]